MHVLVNAIVPVLAPIPPHLTPQSGASASMAHHTHVLLIHACGLHASRKVAYSTAWLPRYSSAPFTILPGIVLLLGPHACRSILTCLCTRVQSISHMQLRSHVQWLASGRSTRQKTLSPDGHGFESVCAPGFLTQLHVITSLSTGGGPINTCTCLWGVRVPR